MGGEIFSLTLENRGHPCCFSMIVGQRLKPLQNDADKRNLLHSEMGVVCSPTPFPCSSRLASLGGEMCAALVRAAHHKGRPSLAGPPLFQNSSLSCFSIHPLRSALRKDFALCGARPEAARLNERGVLSASTSVQYQTDTKCEQQQNQLSLLSPTFCKRLNRKLFNLPKNKNQMNKL